MDSGARLSAIDATFLYFEKPGQPLVVACLVELDANLSYPRLLETIGARLATIPRLRQRPQRVALDVEAPVWAGDPQFQLERHIRHAAWPQPGDDAALRDALERLLAPPLDPEHPLWEAILLEGGARGRSALLFRAHHCMLDGMSGARLLELLTDPLETSTPAAEPPPAQGRAPRLLDSFAGTDQLWDRAKDVAEIASTLLSFLQEQEPPATSFNASLSARRRICWTTLPWKDVAAIRSQAGCTSNDIALAVISGGLRRYIRRHDRGGAREALRALVPVSVRSERGDTSMGNLFSAMFPKLPVHIQDAEERLRAVVRETRALKERGQPRATALLLGALASLPNALGAALPGLLPGTPIFNTICTNVPGPREPRTLAGVKIRAVHGVVPLYQSMGIEFAVMNHADSWSLCAHIDPELVPDEEALMSDLEKSFQELRRAHHRNMHTIAEPDSRPRLRRPNARYKRPESLSSAVKMMAEADAAERQARTRTRRRSV